MWSMVNDFHLDLGAWLARQLTKVWKASSGNIAIGGLITTIALHFNIPLDTIHDYWFAQKMHTIHEKIFTKPNNFDAQ